MAKVKITETVLRDAHQSLIATRMPSSEMEPILDTMDQIGYNAVECWGGATFDSCLRFLKEDPWERLRMLRKHFKNTKLQMLFRGQNILGYNHYADDVVENFVERSIANGIDIIRIFDCLNDIRNLETAVKATKKEGGHAQIALCYTLGDAYTLEYWENLARDVESLGADSLCLKSFGCLKGLPNHVACREEGDVLALVQHVCLSDLERLVWCEVGNLRTAETQIDRTIVFGRGDRRVLCLCPVARVDHNHFRKGTHQGDVLHCLVGGAVLAEGDSGV